MENISGLLARFADFGKKEEKLKKTISDIISGVIKYEIKPESIRYINGSIIVNVSPVVKSEISLNKDEILFSIQQAIQKPIIIHIK